MIKAAHLQLSPTLPSGTLTFLFTDVESSTRLWEQHPDEMRAATSRHDSLIEACVAQNAGVVVRPRGEGDSRFAVFPRATDAVAAASEIQRALFAEAWTTPSSLRVRIALHTGESDLRDGDYYGAAVNRCARLRSAAHGGQSILSQTTYDLVRSGLPVGTSLRDLGRHRLKDLTSPEHIYQLVIAGLPSEFPPLQTLVLSSTNLPIQLTTFVGREKEIAHVKQMLFSTRLLTLVGPGGTGKTRLAVQVADDLTMLFPDGVWLVELAPLSDPRLVPDQVASIFGLRAQSERPLINTLTDYMRTKELLLILDNCEHVIDAAAQLSEALLRACSDLTMLATSREAMDITGECTFRVPALSVPEQIPSAADADLLQIVAAGEAVQLFIDRAVAVQPELRLTPQNVTAVANVCRRLDGIPLAIELAAARVNTLSVEQIARRLDDRFRLLTGGSRTTLPRHQRLRTCIDWSYDLLSEPERLLFRRLSVFAGSWSLQAAEQVCVGDGIESADVLDLYNNLVHKSLVIAEAHAHETRDRMLDTIREYALEKLVESGEAERVRSRHFDYFLNLGENAEALLKTNEQLASLSRLELERDNLRAALDWATQEDIKESGLQLAGALWWYWCIHGDLSEGRELLERMLVENTHGSRPASSVRAKALYGAAHLAWRQGDYDRAAMLSAQSKSICEKLGDRLGLAWSLYNQGLIAQFRGKYNQALGTFEQGLRQFREADSLWGIAMSLDSMGDVLCSRGDIDRAVQVFEESSDLFRKTGDRWGIAHVLCNLGVTESARGDSNGATALLEESVSLYRELGEKSGMAYALDHLGDIARSDGDYARAAALTEEGLTLRREIGNQRGVAASLRHLGKIASMQSQPERATVFYKDSLNLMKVLGDKLGIALLFGDLGELAIRQGLPLRAARLYGAAGTLRRVIGAPMVQTVRDYFQRHLDLLQSRVGESEFARAWNEGATTTLEQAIAFALEGMEGEGL